MMQGGGGMSGMPMMPGGVYGMRPNPYGVMVSQATDSRVGILFLPSIDVVGSSWLAIIESN